MHELANFTPIKKNAPYQPMVLLPDVKYVKLSVVFSVTVDEIEQVDEICASPYYSADELAVLLFRKYDISPD